MAGFPKGSLARKMMVWFVLVILAPCVLLSVFLFTATASRYYDTMVEDHYTVLSVVSENIQSNAAMVENSMDALAYNRDVVKLLMDKGQSAYSRVISLQYDVNDTMAQTRTFLSPLDANIILFAKDERVPVSYWRSLLLQSAEETQDYQAFRDTGKDGAWVGMCMIYPPSTVVWPENNREMFCYYRRIVTGVKNELGVLKCGVAKEKLFAALENPNLPEDIYVFSSAGEGKIFQNKRAGGLPEDIDFTLKRQRTGGKLYLSRSIDELGIYLLMGIDDGEMLLQALRGGMPQLIAALASCLIILLATHTFLRSIQKRIDQAVYFTKQVRAGKMDVTFPNPGEDEVGQLIEAFNVLLTQLQTEAQERIKHEKAEKRALRLALQYQMNPHFLFNTLNWIQMTAELGASGEALSQAITLLGRLLRYNLNEQAAATLEEEMANTRDYVRLMNLRRNDVVTLAFSMEGLPAEMTLIRFFFQPVCENAIQHGATGDKPLHIRIHGYLRGEWACFDIENDGAMIPEEKLERLDIYSREAQRRQGVGLANVYGRLRLMYGDDATLTVTSVPGLTRVSVAFRYGEKDDALLAQEGRETCDC